MVCSSTLGGVNYGGKRQTSCYEAMQFKMYWIIHKSRKLVFYCKYCRQFLDFLHLFCTRWIYYTVHDLQQNTNDLKYTEYDLSKIITTSSANKLFFASQHLAHRPWDFIVVSRSTATLPPPSVGRGPPRRCCPCCNALAWLTIYSSGQFNELSTSICGWKGSMDRAEGWGKEGFGCTRHEHRSYASSCMLPLQI